MLHFPGALRVALLLTRHLAHGAPLAGWPEPPAEEELPWIGAKCAEDRDPKQVDERVAAGGAISLAPPAAKRAASACSSRRNVAVLLGGCGDFRKFFATLIDAGCTARCPDAKRLRLRFVLNDHNPEVLARAYVVLTLLHRAAATLQSNTPPEPDTVSKSTSLALTYVWHVYMSPMLADPVSGELEDVFEELLAAPHQLLPFVSCSDADWAELQAVVRGWREHDMTAEQEMRQAKFTQQQMVTKAQESDYEAARVRSASLMDQTESAHLYRARSPYTPAKCMPPWTLQLLPGIAPPAADCAKPLLPTLWCTAQRAGWWRI